MTDTGNNKMVITEPGILAFGSGLPTRSSITSCFRDESVVQLSCGPYHSAVVCKPGRVYTFGANQPKLVDSLSTVRVTQAACGYEFTVFLSDEGKLYSSGFNGFGQLGLGHTEDVLVPLQVTGIPPIKKIATGPQHTVALADDGDVWVCGENNSGQLGLGHIHAQISFTRVPNLPERIIDISCGGWHTALISISRVLLMAGCDQLCFGIANRVVSTFKSVSLPLTAIAAVSCGTQHTVALGVNGTTWAWGDNEYAQLGTGDTDSRFTPTKVIGLEGRNVSRVIAGNDYTAVLTSEGDVLMCGKNKDNEMGLGEQDILTMTLLPKSPGLVVQQVAIAPTRLLMLVASSTKPAPKLRIGHVDQANMAKNSITDLERSIMRSLECSVCLKIMCAPIHQCVKGHSLCGSCRSDVCLLCRGEFGAARNIALERLSTEMVLPCAECLLRMPACLLAKHGEVCPERQYGCPVSDRCGWGGRPETMLAHARAAHPDRTWTHLPHVFVHARSDRLLRTTLLGAHAQVFTLHRSYDDRQFRAAVRYVGPPENSHGYKFELTFINSDMNSNTYCRDVSSDIESIEDAFQSSSNSVSMKKEMVDTFLQRGCLVCWAAILKVGNSGLPDQIAALLIE